MSAIRSFNFLMYMDNVPDITHCVMSFKHPIVSDVEAMGGEDRVLWACALFGNAGNSLTEFILGALGLEGVLVSPLLSWYCCAMGKL